MSTYRTVPGVDTGVASTANSADARGNLRLRLAVEGEAGILVEDEAPADGPPRFVAIYFLADDLDRLIGHLQAMRAEYLARNGDQRARRS
jgi:hypothetical protein